MNWKDVLTDEEIEHYESLLCSSPTLAAIEEWLELQIKEDGITCDICHNIAVKLAVIPVNYNQRR